MKESLLKRVYLLS